MTDSGGWQPKKILKMLEVYTSSTNVVRVVTDQGVGFLKVLNNPQGPHALACEWVGTSLARWLELSTFDFAIIDVSDQEKIRIQLSNGQVAESGPAFISLSETGGPWNGDSSVLDKINNRGDITRLVIFDTWIRNRDRYFSGDFDGKTENSPRYNYDNVFLGRKTKGAPFTLRVMDHTHCFTGEAVDLSRRLSNLNEINDSRIYGDFPEFRERFDRSVATDTIKKLQVIDRNIVMEIVNQIPLKWDVNSSVRCSLVDFIVQRAAFVADSIYKELFFPGKLFDPHETIVEEGNSSTEDTLS